MIDPLGYFTLPWEMQVTILFLITRLIFTTNFKQLFEFRGRPTENWRQFISTSITNFKI